MTHISSGAATLARLAAIAPVVAAGLLLGGCMSSPTYGTDKTANEQLMTDVTGILALAPKDRASVEYNPRPELVRPDAKDLPLPAPQQRIADSTAWPESPEEKRARLLAQTTANRDSPNFEPSVVSVLTSSPSTRQQRAKGPSSRYDNRIVEPAASNVAEQRKVFKAKLAESRQGSATQRKYLSEPPLVYREPIETAAVDDLGEDESKKKRRRDAAARGGASWRDYVPGL